MARYAAVLAVAVATATLGVSGTASASYLPGNHLPAHLFSPYFEAYNTADDPETFAAGANAKYLTMAFIQTPSPGSCDIDWNGNADQPIALSSYGASIIAIKAHGGDVIPSFGGGYADGNGMDIADSCTYVDKIAADYESVIRTYDVSRLDLDVEGNAETDLAGVDRRNKAIRLVEDWAAHTGRTVQFSYTLPTNPTGLDKDGLPIVQNAVADHASIDVVNLMTFDYYDGLPHEMADDTEQAAAALVGQLAPLYPNRSTRQLYAMVGITEMVGIDDYGPSETFTTADATTVENWAQAKGIAVLSFWAIERDNGNCAIGTVGADNCSGVAQSDWYFSHQFESYGRSARLW
jgi:chitinase